jgi:hypothetical protein
MADSPNQIRNLHPHAEARLAMVLWGHEYAYKQNGGAMDFWDSRNPRQKQLCIDIIDGILEAHSENGRAPEASERKAAS